MRHTPMLPLLPLVPLYAAGVALKNSLYDHGLLRPQRLEWPVVSIGNLSVGGTGKTPFVQELARLLRQQGWYVSVLSRGHGREGKQAEAVDPDGPASRYGDEPLMLACGGLDVYVGRKRYEAGRLAEAQHATLGGKGHSVHLLDDGSQHRKLARAVDIVLVERRDLEDWLLPAGHLREPWKALRRADICVLRQEDRDLAAPVLAAMGTQHAAQVWLQQRVTTIVATADTSLQRAVAFCGIGNAAQFFASVRQTGVSVAAEVTFPDHHAYSDGDMRVLVERAATCRADGFVTTEKDSMRLEGELRETLEVTAPLHIARLAVSLAESERCLDALEALLEKRAGVR